VANKHGHDSGACPSNTNERLKPVFRYLGWRRVGSVLRPPEEKRSSLATWIRCFQDNPLGISSVALALAYFLGALNLWFFTRFVGRPDVFMQSLEFGPGLVALMVSGLATLFIVIGTLVVSSWFFVFPMEYLEFKEDGGVKKITLWLMAVFASGVISFVLIYAFCGYGIKLFLAFVLPSVCAYILVVNYAKKDVSKFILWGLLILVFAILMFLDLVLPYAYMRELYNREVGISGEWYRFAYWLILSLGALLPGVAAGVNTKEGMATKMKHVLVGLLGYVVILTMIIPNIFGVISASSMEILGVSEQRVRRYLVDARQYPSYSLEPHRWLVNDYDGSHYSLNAFSLYKFGPVNLLCPADLSEKNIWDIKSYAHFCIPFRQGAIRKLDAVVECKIDGQ